MLVWSPLLERYQLCPNFWKSVSIRFLSEKKNY